MEHQDILSNEDKEIFSIENDEDKEEPLYNPYNPLNIEITLNDVQRILTKYGLPPMINNMTLYRRAFIHDSYTINSSNTNIQMASRPENCLPLSSKSNERLEFLGDGILECVTKYYLYRRYRRENEGFMTVKKIAMVKNETIGKIALEMGLNRWLIISKSAENQGKRNNIKKLGCLFEAFIGALFLDFSKLEIKDEDKWFENLFVTGPGFQMAQIFIENVFEKHIDWIALIENDDNYKKILQLKIQKEFKLTQNYLEIEYTEENGYRMGVYLCIGYNIHNIERKNALHITNDNLYSFTLIQEYLSQHDGKIFLFLGEGTSKNKKKAEQIACENVLKVLED
jgi:dsRNA-specific ribonuclease